MLLAENEDTHAIISLINSKLNTENAVIKTLKTYYWLYTPTKQQQITNLFTPQKSQKMKTITELKSYKNSFYHADQHLNNPYIHETIYTNSEPVIYNGHEIYKQTPIEYHIVKDGVCIGMVGSLRYAKV